MKMTVQTLTLRLATPFRIAHGTSTERHNVLVHLGDGLGEGALPPYYGLSMRDVVAYLHGLDVDALLAGDPPPLEHVLDALPPGPAPARAAVDLALHDLWGKRLGQPLYRLWGLDPARAPLSARTLSIPESDAAFRETLARHRDAPILKLKIGTGSTERDEEIIRIAREETDARLCVDANSAWTVREAAVLIPRLAEYDLLFIEQPIPAGDPDDWHVLRRHLPAGVPPLIADESAHSTDDAIVLAGAADGVNVKLAKTGGLREARRMITVAKALDMKVLLGCMIESSIAVTAAAHLAPLADFLDLDGTVHLANDPFSGMRFDNGRILLPDRPGLGVTARETALP